MVAQSPRGSGASESLPVNFRDQAANAPVIDVVRTDLNSGAVSELSELSASVGQLSLLPGNYHAETVEPLTAERVLQPTACQAKILNALNRRFPDAKITASNIVPDVLPDRRLAVENVTIHGSEKQLATVSKGRYVSRRHMFFGILIGSGPSLHIVSRPSFLDPHALVFSKTAFTAHLDSAWADTPVGLILHFVIDVLRPKARNPCP